MGNSESKYICKECKKVYMFTSKRGKIKDVYYREKGKYFRCSHPGCDYSLDFLCESCYYVNKESFCKGRNLEEENKHQWSFREFLDGEMISDWKEVESRSSENELKEMRI